MQDSQESQRQTGKTNELMSGSLGNEEFKDQYGLKLVMNKLNNIIGEKITDLNIVQ